MLVLHYIDSFILRKRILEVIRRERSKEFKLVEY